jgi:hypothetical protein
LIKPDSALLRWLRIVRVAVRLFVLILLGPQLIVLVFPHYIVLVSVLWMMVIVAIFLLAVGEHEFLHTWMVYAIWMTLKAHESLIS